MPVTLANGSELDLAELDPNELHRLQFEQEKEFASRIVASPKRSAKRAEAIERGYDTVCAILAQLRSEETESPLVMGLDRRYARLVIQLLRKRQRRSSGEVSFFEIGYGSGQLLREVNMAGYQIAGIEVSPLMREQAMTVVPSQCQANLFVGNLFDHFDSHDNLFDVVYWNDVFEHIPCDEIADLLERIHALIRPGGCLMTITPNWHERPSDVTGDFLPPRSEAIGLHLKEYTVREVTGLLHDAGFTKVVVPLIKLPHRFVMGFGGLTSLKRASEPLLEYLPFRAAQLLCRVMGLSCTIAYKAT